MIIILAALSLDCKKEETETTKSYLSGSLSVGSIPPYVNGGDSIEFTLKGVTYPSTETDTTYTLGVYYMNTTVSSSYDTVYNALTNPYYPGCKFKIALPDSLGTYSILISIYPSASDKYYTSSHTSTIVVVDDYLSIPEISPYPAFELFTDPRDGHDYSVITCGGKKWLNRNLAYAGTADKPMGIPYSRTECMSYVFGRYYSWDEAQTACPEGWKLPSSADWDLVGNVAGDLMVDGYFNGETKLWEFWPDVFITNKTGLGFIPAGYCNNVSYQFDGLLEYASFWTSDKKEVQQSGKKMQFGVYRYVYVRDADFKTGLLDPVSQSMPIRCIKTTD